ncbi:unnamed protein product [Caenorhabditis auriculariae]|uniref:Uncharacterized protein n=1 Tax=Caenorhabditis auriculariae TaxID=2777116 RepID=A0A8S1H2C2_9PELO|nr:unnamed protein product [Caenorhabditis auriculariae]
MRPQAVLTVLLVMLETFTSSEYSEASGGSSEMTTPTKAEVVGMTTEIRRHREEPQGPGRTEEALLTSSEYSEVLGGSSEMSPTSSVKAEVNGVTSEVGRRREEPQKPGRSKEASLTSSEHSEAVGLPSEAWRRQEDLERSIEPSEASGSEKENLSSEPTVSAARRSPETPATFWRRRQEPQKSSLESDSSPVTSSTFQTPSSESSTKSTLPRTSHQRMKRSSNLQRPRRHRLRLQKDLRRRRRDYDPADDDDDDYDEDMAALARGDDDEELEEEEKQLTWMNPEHPERRPGRFIGEEQTEFVRTEYTDAAYKKLRTYSEFFHYDFVIEQGGKALDVTLRVEGSIPLGGELFCRSFF